MKCLSIICCLTILFYASRAQSDNITHQTFKSVKTGTGVNGIMLQNNSAFSSNSKSELLNRNYLVNLNSETGYTFRRGIDATANLLFMPASYQPGEMMNIVSMYATLGKLKFQCNNYFDAEGQLQDGDITITKIK